MFKILTTFLVAGLIGFCSPKTQAANYVQESVVAVTPYGQVSSPGGEQYFNVTDGNIGTKYLNFNKTNVGFTVQLAAPTIIRQLALTTANDVPARDPMTIAIYGSNVQGQLGTLIANDVATNLSTNRYTTSNVAFDNSTSYTYYTVVYLTLRNYAAANSVQLAEAQFLYDTQYNPAPAYTSNITTQQQDRVTAAANRLMARTNSTPNEIYVNQIGSNNTFNFTQTGPGNLIDGAVYDINTGVADYTKYAPINGGNNQITIRQGDPGSRTGKNIVDLAVTGSGNILNLNQGTDTTGLYTGADQGGHYQFIWVNGTNNYITTEQQNSSTNSGHFASLAVQGDLNTVGITQTGNAQKQLFASINGTSNTMTTNQSGNSAHYLDVKLTGNGNSAVVDQNNTGATGSNHATINLINAGGPASVNLTQTGNQTYSISQTCITAGGCGTITVKQGN